MEEADGEVYTLAPPPIVSQLLEMVWDGTLYKGYAIEYVTWLVCNLQPDRFLNMSSKGITKLYTHLNPAPSNSTQLSATS